MCTFLYRCIRFMYTSLQINKCTYLYTCIHYCLHSCTFMFTSIHFCKQVIFLHIFTPFPYDSTMIKIFETTILLETKHKGVHDHEENKGKENQIKIKKYPDRFPCQGKYFIKIIVLYIRRR